MARGTNYFSHDYNARIDEKIRLLIRRNGMEGYGLYWAIIEDLYQNNNSLKADFDLLAYEYRVSEEKIKSVINDFRLFEIDGENLFSNSINKRLSKRDEKSEKAKVSAVTKWGDSAASNKLKRSERLSQARVKGSHKKHEWEAMKLFFGCCVRCESTDQIVKDHIIPIYQGGSDGIDNLQPLCKKCNSSKGPENTDHRPAYCLRHQIEMPANYCEMPAIKERKVKEKKVNESKGKEESGAVAPTPEQILEVRKKEFYATLVPFLKQYGKEMLRDFYEYWTEPNKSKSLFKQEMQKTWDLSMRLNTWAKRDTSFVKQNPVISIDPLSSRLAKDEKIRKEVYGD